MLRNGEEIESDADSTYRQEEGASGEPGAVINIKAFDTHDDCLVANVVH